MLGHGSPVSPNPHAGHTSHQTGPTPSQSIQLMATLGTAPSEAAAFSTGRALVRPPPTAWVLLSPKIPAPHFPFSHLYPKFPPISAFNLSSRRWLELVIVVWVLGEMEAEIRNWWPDIDKFVGVCCGCGGVAVVLLGFVVVVVAVA
ncbi:hypothetical protein Adt_38741 [Abeliophyllum distichum]|uniref:Uncharacterized protein n=1 Tax=Abeliophyllum distichum TaxID=126358 RepID=A0ABD1Q3A4_9LAMI